MSILAETEMAEGKGVVEVEYHPAPLVQAFIRDTTFCTGFFGPLGCGKTTGGTFKAWTYAQAFPGARIAVVRDTWPNLRDTTQHTLFHWFPEPAAGRYHRTSKTFFLHTGDGSPPAEILFRAMEDKDDVGNVLSLDLAAAWIDEPQGGLALRGTSIASETGIDHELFLSILGRLGRQSGYPPMCWLTGNPPDPKHWIAREFGYPGHGEPANPREKFRLYLGDRETNREHLRQGYYEDLAEIFGIGTPMAMRFLDGQWVSFAVLNPFKEESIRFYERRPTIDDMVICFGVDPAISKKDAACRTAMVVAGQPLRGVERTTAFVLKAIADRWSPYESAASILRLCHEFPKARKLRIEDVAWQRALGDIVQREATLSGIRLPALELVRPETDKLRRAMGFSGLVESGRVLFGPGQADLINCLLSVPKDPAAWDLVDALGLALGGLPQTAAERTRIAPVDSEEARKRAASYRADTSSLFGAQTTRREHTGPSRQWRTPAVAQRARSRSYVSGFNQPKEIGSWR